MANTAVKYFAIVVGEGVVNRGDFVFCDLHGIKFRTKLKEVGIHKITNLKLRIPNLRVQSYAYCQLPTDFIRSSNYPPDCWWPL